MAVSGGPDVVTDGLVLAIDATNTKSFRGEPTTNLLPQPLSFSTGYTQESWTTGLVEDNAVIAPDGTMTATKITRVSGYFYKRNTVSPTFTINVGDTITFSCWVKKLDSTNQTGRGINIWCYNGAGNGNRASATQSIESGEWVRQSVTYTALSGETDFAFGFSGAIASHLQGIIAIWRPQVEIKAYATPFVSGSRGTTVATGGGWADVTGNNNHGELVNGPTFSSANGGSIVFDGTNDYVNCGDILNAPTTLSVNFWVKNANGGVIITKGYRLWEIRIADSEFGGYVGISTGAFWYGISDQHNILHGVNLTEWNNFTYVLDYTTTNVSFYANGVLKGSITVPNMVSTYSPTFNLNLGRRVESDNNQFSGNISQVQIYNRILTAQEILQNFNSTRSRFGV